jgi:type II secretory pathway component PulM
MTKRKVVKPQPTKLQDFWAAVKAGDKKTLLFIVAVTVLVLLALVF